MEYIIYEIREKEQNITPSEVLYIGSTKSLRHRKSQHKRACNNSKQCDHNFKLYDFIRNHGGFNNFDLFPLEKFICKDRTEARIREQYWIDQKQTVLNVMKAYTSEDYKKKQKSDYQREHIKTNLKKRRLWHKKYEQENKEQIKIRKILYNEINKE